MKKILHWVLVARIIVVLMIPVAKPHQIKIKVPEKSLDHYLKFKVNLVNMFILVN